MVHSQDTCVGEWSFSTVTCVPMLLLLILGVVHQLDQSSGILVHMEICRTAQTMCA